MALLRYVVANVRNASITTSTPSAWCRSACRKRLYSAWRWALGMVRHVAIVSERYWLAWEKSRTSTSALSQLKSRIGNF